VSKSGCDWPIGRKAETNVRSERERGEEVLCGAGDCELTSATAAAAAAASSQSILASAASDSEVSQ